MIQRIQTIFLVVSLCFLFPMFFLPLAELIIESGEIQYFSLVGFYQTEAGAIHSINCHYLVMMLGIVICALNLIAIFMYRKRTLQIRLCLYNIFLLVGLTGVMLFVLYVGQNVQSISFNVPVVFPVISIILHYLALRGIRKDEQMVQSLNRLR